MSDLFIRPLFTWRSAVASKFGPKSPTTRHVLLTLSLYMSEKGDSCYPATRTLSDETGLSHRAVLTHLETAEREGWIGRRERVRKGKGWKRMEYFAVIPPGIEDSIKAEKEEKERDEGRSPAIAGEGSSPPFVGEPGADGGERRSIRGERGDVKVVKDVHLKSSVNTPKISTEKARPRRPGEDYTPTPEVLAWVKKNGFEPWLQIHIEQFRDTCKTQSRKPYAIDGLDAAFRNCVRSDWGGVRRQAQIAARAPGGAPLQQRALEQRCRYCSKTAVNTVSGIPFCSAKECENAAYDGRPAPKPQPPETRV